MSWAIREGEEVILVFDDICGRNFLQKVNLMGSMNYDDIGLGDEFWL